MKPFVLALEFASPGAVTYAPTWWFDLHRSRGEFAQCWRATILGVSLVLRVYEPLQGNGG